MGVGTCVQKALVEKIQTKDPFVMFIAETWTDDARLDRIQQDIDFQHHWVVSSTRRGGGLVLFWKTSFNLSIEGSSKFFIDSLIDKNTKNMWCRHSILHPLFNLRK